MTATDTPSLPLQIGVHPQPDADADDAMFACDWRDVLFVHFAVESAALRPVVSFELDLHEGRAIVSVLALTVTRYRTCVAGRPRPSLGPADADHHVVDVRVCVRCGPHRGHQVLLRWLSLPVDGMTAPVAYGLPCRTVHIEHGHHTGTCAGSVTDADGRRLCWTEAPERGNIAPAGTDRYPLLRNVMFTRLGRGPRRRFHLRHGPWNCRPAGIRLLDEGLLAASGEWAGRARRCGAHYAAAVRDVRISRPACIEGRFTKGGPAGRAT